MSKNSRSSVRSQTPRRVASRLEGKVKNTGIQNVKKQKKTKKTKTPSLLEGVGKRIRENNNLY